MTGTLLAIGVGIVVCGGAYGISHIGGKAMDAIARQPEAAGDIRSSMIIMGAFIEGATLIATLLLILLK